MIVRTESDIKETGREVDWGGGISQRHFLKSDGVPVGLNRVFVRAGGPYKLQYLFHTEVVVCVAGKGQLLDKDGKTTEINPGTSYCAQSEPHAVTALEDMQVVCSFSPPLSGNERMVELPNGHYTYVPDKLSEEHVQNAFAALHP